MNFRRSLLFLHRWVGLVSGLLLLLLGLTGSVLSFQREIDVALNPALFRASGPADPALGFSAVLRIAEQAGGRPIGMIRPPDAVWPVWVAYDRRARGGPGGFWTTHIDPANGQVLGRRDVSTSFIATMRQLHEALLLRDLGGREAVGWAGVVLFLLSLSGIWLWWPRGGGFWPAMTVVRRRPFIRLNLDLHKVAGIWILSVMAVVAFSGTVIVFPQWFRLGVPAPARPAATEPRRERMTVDADAAVAAARQAAGPGQIVTTLAPPAPQSPRWQVSLRPEGSDPELRVRTAIGIDPWSAEVLDERSPRTRGLAEEFLVMQRWLHGGQLLGMAGRLAVFLSGLALVLLFTTGLLAWVKGWLNRRARRAVAAAAKAPAGAQAGQ